MWTLITMAVRARKGKFCNIKTLRTMNKHHAHFFLSFLDWCNVLEIFSAMFDFCSWGSTLQITCLIFLTQCRRKWEQKSWGISLVFVSPFILSVMTLLYNCPIKKYFVKLKQIILSLPWIVAFCFIHTSLWIISKQKMDSISIHIINVNMCSILLISFSQVWTLLPKRWRLKSQAWHLLTMWPWASDRMSLKTC